MIFFFPEGKDTDETKGKKKTWSSNVVENRVLVIGYYRIVFVNARQRKEEEQRGEERKSWCEKER